MSQTLENVCQQLIAGVAGMVGDVVRPRWQGPDPPNLPPYGTDWVAVGITRKRPIGIYGATIHQNPEPGTDLMQRHEEFDLLCSFYGPNADVYSSSLHDGLMIWQNKSELRLVGMAFVEITEGIRVPELIKNQWTDRVDKTVILRRIIQRTYPVRNIVWAGGWINTDLPPYRAPFHAP